MRTVKYILFIWMMISLSFLVLYVIIEGKFPWHWSSELQSLYEFVTILFLGISIILAHALKLK